MNNRYEKEVRERWGDTEAYSECEQRTADYDLADWNELSAGMDAIMAGFAELRSNGISPHDGPARLQVERLKRFITEHMYTCTDEILAGLGQMYVADERFKNNIDKRGENTAAYVSECIKSYCG